MIRGVWDGLQSRNEYRLMNHENVYIRERVGGERQLSDQESQRPLDET
jgi:hypothetical protein